MRTAMHPAAIELRAAFLTDAPIDDRLLDAALGIPEDEPRATLEASYRLGRADEQPFYLGVPYALTRNFLRYAMPNADDIFYDLGAGYGRVLLFGAVNTPADYRGIELVPDRAEHVNANANRLGLRNVHCITRNVRNARFEDGTIFFLYSPFTKNTLEHVGGRLEDIAAKHPITIGSVDLCSEYFSQQPWLRNVVASDIKGLQVYRSD